MYSPPRLPQAQEAPDESGTCICIQTPCHSATGVARATAFNDDARQGMLMPFLAFFSFFFLFFLPFFLYLSFSFFYDGGHTDGQGMCADRKGIQLTCHDALVPAEEYLEQSERERRKNR